MTDDLRQWLTEELLAVEVGQPATVNILTDPDATCPCVADHNPNVVVFNRHHILPLAWGGTDSEDNMILLCPTGHYTVHTLLRIARQQNVHPDELPWDIRRKAGPNLRAVAADGWDRWDGP